MPRIYPTGTPERVQIVAGDIAGAGAADRPQIIGAGAGAGAPEQIPDNTGTGAAAHVRRSSSRYRDTVHNAQDAGKVAKNAK